MAQQLFMLVFSDDIDAAPLNKVLMAWGNGGWRFMKRDEVGQWRSIRGLPKPAPKMWSLCPKEATGETNDAR